MSRADAAEHTAVTIGQVNECERRHVKSIAAEEIADRQIKEIYISNWYVLAACLWTAVVYVTGYLPWYQKGLSQTVICKQAGAALIIVTGTSRDAARMEVAKALGVGGANFRLEPTRVCLELPHSLLQALGSGV